jgi:hypothetical protein
MAKWSSTRRVPKGRSPAAANSAGPDDAQRAGGTRRGIWFVRVGGSGGGARAAAAPPANASGIDTAR